MSDHEGDTESDDEDSSDDENRKPIPLWAKSENLQKQIKRQFERDSKGNFIDPNTIFAYVDTCNLDGKSVLW